MSLFSFVSLLSLLSFFFFSTITSTTEIYTLSLHDALPIWWPRRRGCSTARSTSPRRSSAGAWGGSSTPSRTRPCPAPSSRCGRSEEHTSELQSQFHLVCRLLLEKKKNKNREDH